MVHCVRHGRCLPSLIIDKKSWQHPQLVTSCVTPSLIEPSPQQVDISHDPGLIFNS
ncbi:uncharacterized protein F5147DRAFT_761647 [Suillus discolor]|uniref:Uncharacterized protein n=1 Tax=Suillus discolor TaxID=1912936 RepID=A0A9P7F522_9AGAM|nr:uncharacterized protein F5147DRAFT_761647 [Suillus discolor]KAG2106548.1 hypothetical protein F5147DRAFT_761647 [Suillus discolor]